MNPLRGTPEREQVEGRHPVRVALEAGKRPVLRIWVARGIESHGDVGAILHQAQKDGVEIRSVDKTQIDAMAAGTAHQGIVAETGPYPYMALEDGLRDAMDSSRPPFVLVTAHIQDPHNLGSLIRSSECAGVHMVIIPARRAAQITPSVVKASAGATEYMQVARVPNIANCVERLKQAGIWVFAGDLQGEDIYASDLRGPIAVVVGGEAKGVPPRVRKSCDFTVRIPLAGRIPSLNASVAGAVLLYEVVRQRGQKLVEPRGALP